MSARFAYPAAVKSIDNLLLLGDGESWARQRIDFDGLPEVVRCFLQVAAGSTDKSPMPMHRHETGARPAAAGGAPRPAGRKGSTQPLTSAFRPLWRLGAAGEAAQALSNAQATQVYAGLRLWLAKVAAKLVEDGTCANAAVAFAEGSEFEDLSSLCLTIY